MDSRKRKQQKEEKRKKQREKNGGQDKIMVIMPYMRGVGGSGADTQETWDSHCCKTLQNTTPTPGPAKRQKISPGIHRSSLLHPVQRLPFGIGVTGGRFEMRHKEH